MCCICAGIDSIYSKNFPNYLQCKVSYGNGLIVVLWDSEGVKFIERHGVSGWPEFCCILFFSLLISFSQWGEACRKWQNNLRSLGVLENVGLTQGCNHLTVCFLYHTRRWTQIYAGLKPASLTAPLCSDSVFVLPEAPELPIWVRALQDLDWSACTMLWNYIGSFPARNGYFQGIF